MKVYVYRVEHENGIRDYIIWVRLRIAYDDDNWYKSFYTDKFPRKKFSKKFCISRTYLQVSKRSVLVGSKSIKAGFDYTLIAEYDLP